MEALQKFNQQVQVSAAVAAAVVEDNPQTRDLVVAAEALDMELLQLDLVDLMVIQAAVAQQELAAEPEELAVVEIPELVELD
jgi:hypothetical protein